MKKSIFSFLLFNALSILAISAQDKVVHFVFTEFHPAKVLYKNGNITNTELNYHKATEEMVYTDDSGKKMAIYPIEKIDTVFIEGRKFVPEGRAFYEVIGTSKYPLYVAHKCRMSMVASNVGYGSSSTTAVENISSLSASGEVYQLKLPDNFKASSSTNYYIYNNGEYIKINKLKDIVSLFPDKESELNSFIKKEKIKNNEKGYLSLLNFIN